jgi:hypothetical protein
MAGLRGGPATQFAVMGSGSRFAGLVLGLCLTLVAADGCAGEARRIGMLARRSRS